MIKSKKQTRESYAKSHYISLIVATLGVICFYTLCTVTNLYTDAQIHMLEGILSMTIPLSIGLATCYFITRGKTQNQWYIRVISYTACISALAPTFMILSNAFETFFPYFSPWTYYILSTVFLILLIILEVREYNKTNTDT